MNGLGCALIQDDKPVCYASRALTEAESRYSNILAATQLTMKYRFDTHR